MGVFFLSDRLPFIETICGKDAASVSKWFLKTGFFPHSFRTGIDHLVSNLFVLRPGRNETPMKSGETVPVLNLSENCDILPGRDLFALFEIFKNF